ncbi:Protein of unknown function DUF4817, partial [Trinorchestia longiramus]
MQLTKEQRVFVVTIWISTKSIKRVEALFAQHFPGRRSSCKDTIWKNTYKYRREGTSRNLNNGRSGRKRTARSKENALNLLLQTPQVSVRTNDLLLTKSSFNRIVVCDLHWYLYKSHVRHQLLETDFPTRWLFAEWLLNKHARFMEKVVIGNKAAFFMNGKEGSNGGGAVELAASPRRVGAGGSSKGGQGGQRDPPHMVVQSDFRK